METHSVVEHICLASDTEDSSQARVINRRFEQLSNWRRRRAVFTVFNEYHVAIETSGLGRKPRGYQFDLSFLSSRPNRVIRIDWTLALLALALLAVGVGTLVYGTVAVLLSVALLMGGFCALLLALCRSSDRLVYLSKHGRAPLLVLQNKTPDPTALQSFTTELGQRIRRGRHRWPDRRSYLSAELREHRRLHEEGILSQQEYERIKRRILDRHG
jgi:hypothetical protein